MSGHRLTENTLSLKNVAITAVIALVAVVAYDKYRQSKG